VFHVKKGKRSNAPDAHGLHTARLEYQALAELGPSAISRSKTTPMLVLPDPPISRIAEVSVTASGGSAHAQIHGSPPCHKQILRLPFFPLAFLLCQPLLNDFQHVEPFFVGLSSDSQSFGSRDKVDRGIMEPAQSFPEFLFFKIRSFRRSPFCYLWPYVSPGEPFISVPTWSQWQRAPRPFVPEAYWPRPSRERPPFPVPLHRQPGPQPFEHRRCRR